MVIFREVTRPEYKTFSSTKAAGVGDLNWTFPCLLIAGVQHPGVPDSVSELTSCHRCESMNRTGQIYPKHSSWKALKTCLFSCGLYFFTPDLSDSQLLILEVHSWGYHFCPRKLVALCGELGWHHCCDARSNSYLKASPASQLSRKSGDISMRNEH